jgi:hypothetical protein
MRLVDTCEAPINCEARINPGADAGIPMKLRYGFNEIGTWRQFAFGPERECVWARLRAVDTHVVRIGAFDTQSPDPIAAWDDYRAYLEAVLQAGAVPMLTIMRFGQPYDAPQSVKWLADSCREVARRCVDTWGAERVGEWYWCLGYEPNSAWSSAGLTFEQYRRIYEETAHGISRGLQPRDKLRVGGPSVDGFQPFWIDWIWRLLDEVDESLIGFVCWHRYGDWREPGTWGAPADLVVFRDLLLSRTPEYEVRARAAGRLLRGRRILNICSELNAHSHYEIGVAGAYNQTLFGATYYGSALIHLMRGGADAEMFSGGIAAGDPYGILDPSGAPTPAYYAKLLCSRNIRFGDRLFFAPQRRNSFLDWVAGIHPDGSCSAFLVNHSAQPVTYSPPDLPDGPEWQCLLKLDQPGASCPTAAPYDGQIAFQGYGVAVLSTADGGDA